MLYSTFFKPQTRTPQKSQNFDINFEVSHQKVHPQKEHIKWVYIILRLVWIFKSAFFAYFGISLHFFYLQTGFIIPSLLKKTCLVSIHHNYICSLQFLSFSLFFLLKQPNQAIFVIFLVLFQAQKCPTLAILVLISHMEDINYVFNGEIKGNFNSYILIYDNLFLLQAICL